MSLSRMFPRKNLARRARRFAALVGLLALALTAAPGTAAATTTPEPAAASLTLSPGDPIYSGGVRCTLGFNLTDGEGVYILTAGHCTAAGSYWYADPGETVPIGPAVHSSFPAGDFGLIRYEDPGLAAPGQYTVGSPHIGQQVYTITPGTGVHSGVVTALNVTVNQGGGNIVYGLIQTNICAGEGVSGAPLLGGGHALGIGTIGSGSCSSGGTTFFQPLDEVLAMFGLTLY